MSNKTINLFKKLLRTASLSFMFFWINALWASAWWEKCELPKPNYWSCWWSSFHNVDDANENLCNPWSTPIWSAQWKDWPRSWQCKWADQFLNCPEDDNKDNDLLIPWVTNDCKAFPLWTMVPWRLQLEIPVTNWIQTDIVARQKELNSWNSKESLKWFFRLLNEWMWMLLMLVLFIAVIYAWYTLITSVWDSEKMKTGLRMLLYVVFWLVIAILSWAVISLIAWMFA